MPVFPFIYISIGVILSKILDQRRQMLNAYLIALVLFTAVTMVSSNVFTGLEVRNLKPVPVPVNPLEQDLPCEINNFQRNN